MESIWNAPFVETEKLAACAAASARLLPPRGQCRGRRALPALYRSGEEIRRDTALLRRRSQSGAQLPPAWEWLLDNEYLARREHILSGFTLNINPILNFFL